jgi:hypothetical protein
VEVAPQEYRRKVRVGDKLPAGLSDLRLGHRPLHSTDSHHVSLRLAAWRAIDVPRAALHGVKLGDIVAVNGVGFAGNIMLQGQSRRAHPK